MDDRRNRGARWGCGAGVLALLMAVGCGTSQREVSTPPEPAFRVENGFIVDADNRVLIPRGYNYANDHKFPHAETGTFFPAWQSPDDFQEMRRHGFNSVRLLLTWEAVEPQRGVYDDRFLDLLDERIAWAAAAGQWVILDMHQDVYSRSFLGDGAPAWAVDSDGLPFVPQGQWYLNFLSPAVQRAIDNFFNNKNGFLDHFVEAWAQVVRRVRHRPGVLGYNLLNEPFPGSKALTVDVADREVMNPFYQKLLDTLAPLDARRLFFLEPNAVRTNVYAGAFPSKMGPFTGADGRVVFSPHLYDPAVTVTGQYDGNPARLQSNVTALAGEAVRLDAALWVGEWSVWDGRVINEQAFLADQLDAMDDALAGWSFWNFSRNPQDLTSPTQSPSFLDQLARPQLSRIAGTPESMRCTATGCVFAFREAAAGGPTEILVPAQWSATFSHTVDPPRAVTLRKEGDLSVLDVAANATGETVTVTLVR